MAERRITGRTVLLSLVAFFGVVTAANAAMIWLALSSWTGVETQSAYKDGAHYPREIAAAEAQVERHWNVSADLVRLGDGADITVAMRDAAKTPLPGLALKARLERPTQDKEDVDVVLSEGEVGRYSGRFPDVAPGKWTLVLEAERGGERVFRSVNRISVE